MDLIYSKAVEKSERSNDWRNKVHISLKCLLNGPMRLCYAMFIIIIDMGERFIYIIV